MISRIDSSCYFYKSETALYFYETADSEPETIFEEPLEVGQSWQRFGSSTANSNNMFAYLLDIGRMRITVPPLVIGLLDSLS